MNLIQIKPIFVNREKFVKYRRRTIFNHMEARSLIGLTQIKEMYSLVRFYELVKLKIGSRERMNKIVMGGGRGGGSTAQGTWNNLGRGGRLGPPEQREQ